MRTYAEHLSHAGTAEAVSYAGGRTRHIVWTLDGGTVTGRLFGNVIVEARPGDVTISTAGHNTPSTVEALNVGAFGSDGAGPLRNHGGELHYGRERVTDGMVLDYGTGRVLSHGAELAPVRGVTVFRDGNVVEVGTTGRAGRRVAEAAARRFAKPGQSVILTDSHPNYYTFAISR